MLRVVGVPATTSAEALAAWRRRNASLLVKSTIGLETGPALARLARRRWSMVLPAKRNLAALQLASVAPSPDRSRMDGAGFFSDQFLFLRDPVRQYLSLRVKYWCENCGGFAEKFEAQERLLVACLRLRHAPALAGGELHPSCPFHAVLSEDVLDGVELPRWLLLGPLPGGRPVSALSVDVAARKARNTELGLSASLVASGNLARRGEHSKAPLWRPQLARRVGSWNCEVASRVWQLCPTLYEWYYPRSRGTCDGPRVVNGSGAAARASVADTYGPRGARRSHVAVAAGRRRGRARAEPPRRRPIPLICDAFVGSRAPNCSAIRAVVYRTQCERIGATAAAEREAAARRA